MVNKGGRPKNCKHCKSHPCRCGRPTVMTPEVIRKLEEAFSMGCSDLEACLFADISKSTLYDYQKSNPLFAERKEALKEKPVLKARSIVMKALNDHDQNTAKWYLERKKKSEFSSRQDIGLNPDGEPVKFTIKLGKNIEKGDSDGE